MNPVKNILGALKGKTFGVIKDDALGSLKNISRRYCIDCGVHYVQYYDPNYGWSDWRCPNCGKYYLDS
jgi:hypothetical protein